MLKQCVRLELRKAFQNNITRFTFLFVIILSVTSLEGLIERYEVFRDAFMNGDLSGNPMLPAFSLFSGWMGARVASFETSLFYFLFPVLAALPFGWSMAGEMRSGYTRNVLCRTSRKTYFLSKYIAVFISGAIVILVPLVLNFLLTSMILPALKPEGCYPYGTIGIKSMWSGIYMEHPLVYTIMYILLNALFAGLTATLSATLAFYIRQKIVVILIPLFLFLLIDYLNMCVWIVCEYSPMKFLYALPVVLDRYGEVVTLEAVLLFVCTLGTVLWKERKYEVL